MCEPSVIRKCGAPVANGDDGHFHVTFANHPPDVEYDKTHPYGVKVGYKADLSRCDDKARPIAHGNERHKDGDRVFHATSIAAPGCRCSADEVFVPTEDKAC